MPITGANARQNEVMIPNPRQKREERRTPNDIMGILTVKRQDLESTRYGVVGPT